MPSSAGSRSRSLGSLQRLQAQPDSSCISASVHGWAALYLANVVVLWVLKILKFHRSALYVATNPLSNPCSAFLSEGT